VARSFHSTRGDRNPDQGILALMDLMVREEREEGRILWFMVQGPVGPVRPLFFPFLLQRFHFLYFLRMEIFLGVLFCWMDDTPTLGALVIAQVVWAVFVFGVWDLFGVFVAGYTPTFDALTSCSVDQLWSFWSFGMLADFIFPRSGSSNAPRFFGFHPAEFGLMINLILFLLPNTFFPSFRLSLSRLVCVCPPSVHRGIYPRLISYRIVESHATQTLPPQSLTLHEIGNRRACCFHHPVAAA
jgi:hypothetical protein